MSQIDSLLREAVALHRTGRLAAAEQIYRKILAQNSNDPNALNLLGVLASQCGQPQAGIDLISRAIRISPQLADYHTNLGEAFRKLGDHAQATESFHRAIELDPKCGEAHSNLALSYYQTGRLIDAEKHARVAVETRADRSTAFSNLGVILQAQNRTKDAIEAHRRSVELNGGNAECLYNLSISLLLNNQIEEAEQLGRRATEIDPRSSGAHLNLANSLKAQGRLTESLQHLRRALEIRPNDAIASHNLLFYSHYVSDDPQALTAEHVQWAQGIPPSIPPVHTNDRSPDRRLRIGYVSSDFRRHSVAWFLEPVLKHHDAEQVEIFCYSNMPAGDETTLRMKEQADTWRQIVGQDDDAVAQVIREDRIDILVDLSVHSSGNRLLVFARKPAPLQVTWLGYCGSTGLPAMDYRLTDDLVDPPALDRTYGTEQPWRLPEIFCCYAPPHDAPEVGPSPAERDGIVTFGSLNTLSKITPAIMDDWSAILHAAPRSRLLMKAAGLHEPSLRDRVVGEFAKRGIPVDRLILERESEFDSYLQTFHRIDIHLDSFPFNGHTTTCHGLWMGVPTVTRSGRTPVSRVGRDLMSVIGLPDLAAEGSADYIRIATALAGNVPRLRQLRAGMRDRLRSSPLCNAAGFTAALESAYRAMWRKYALER